VHIVYVGSVHLGALSHFCSSTEIGFCQGDFTPLPLLTSLRNVLFVRCMTQY